MGKSSIDGSFSMVMLNNQRVNASPGYEEPKVMEDGLFKFADVACERWFLSSSKRV